MGSNTGNTLGKWSCCQSKGTLGLLAEPCGSSTSKLLKTRQLGAEKYKKYSTGQHPMPALPHPFKTVINSRVHKAFTGLPLYRHQENTLRDLPLCNCGVYHSNTGTRLWCLFLYFHKGSHDSFPGETGLDSWNMKKFPVAVKTLGETAGKLPLTSTSEQHF